MDQTQRFQAGKVTLISLGHFFHDIYTSFLAPLIPLLIEKFSLTYSMVSFLGLLHRLPNLMNPFLGMLADRIAMRYLVILSPALTAIAMGFIGVAPSITFLAILLIIAGISSSLYHVPTPVMVRKVSGDKVGRGMSIFMFGGEMARTLGPLIALGAVSLWGLEGTYKTIPLGIAASAILYFKLRKIKISEDFGKGQDMASLRQTVRAYLPFFLILVGITFFRSIMRSALTVYLPTYMTVRGETIWTGGVFLSVLEMAGALGVLFWGTYSDRIGRKRALLLIVLLAPVLMFIFSSLSGWIALPVLILLGFFLLGTTPILLALTQDRASERPAFFNGVFLTISFGSEAAALMVVGALGDWIGLVDTFRLSSFLALGAIPFVFMIRAKNRV